MHLLKKYFPHILLGVNLLLFLILLPNPNNRLIWLVENITAFLPITILVITYKKFRFSNLSYFLMSIATIMGIYGGHYNFSEVPFDFVTDLFGFERNNYDRFAHFVVGLYAYPIAEFLTKKKIITDKKVLIIFSLSLILAVGALYEIIEWLSVEILDKQTSAGYLGEQGDRWDPQKDMLLDGLGAIVGLVLFKIFGWNKNQNPNQSKAKT